MPPVVEDLHGYRLQDNIPCSGYKKFPLSDAVHLPSLVLIAGLSILSLLYHLMGLF
jgi:hypothetical protein